MAFKTALALAVCFSGITAFGAALTGVPGVDLLDLEARQFAFIFNEPEQPVKTPPVHPAVLEPAFSDATAFPDVLEVLKGQRRACWNGVHDASGQHVVAFLAKPIDLPAKLLQHPLGRLGAFALQDPTVFKHFMFRVSPSFIPQEPVELPVGGRHDRRLAYPQVPDHQAAGDERPAVAFQDNVQEHPVPLAPDQLGRADLPLGLKLTSCLPSTDDRVAQPSFSLTMLARLPSKRTAWSLDLGHLNVLGLSLGFFLSLASRLAWRALTEERASPALEKAEQMSWEGSFVWVRSFV